MLRDQHRALFTYESQPECSPVAPRNSKDAELRRGVAVVSCSKAADRHLVPILEGSGIFYGRTCVR